MKQIIIINNITGNSNIKNITIITIVIIVVIIIIFTSSPPPLSSYCHHHHRHHHLHRHHNHQHKHHRRRHHHNHRHHLVFPPVTGQFDLCLPHLLVLLPLDETPEGLLEDDRQVVQLLLSKAFQGEELHMEGWMDG